MKIGINHREWKGMGLKKTLPRTSNYTRWTVGIPALCTPLVQIWRVWGHLFFSLRTVPLQSVLHDARNAEKWGVVFAETS